MQLKKHPKDGKFNKERYGPVQDMGELNILNRPQ
jgi:hypothetical protein